MLKKISLFITGIAATILIAVACYAATTFSAYYYTYSSFLNSYGVGYANFTAEVKPTESLANQYNINKDKYVKQCWVRLSRSDKDSGKVYSLAASKAGEKGNKSVQYEMLRNIFYHITFTYGWVYF